MDIFEFINSRDIREHLQKINYSFSSLEAAWIIWKSKYTSLQEKHDAWNEIIKTMPDCKIEERSNTRPYPSLHAYLTRLMEIENNCIEMVLRQEPNTFYIGTYTSENDWHYGHPSKSYAECFEDTISYCHYDSVHDDTSAYRIRIRKVWFDGRDEKIGLEVTPKGEILKILYADFKSCDEINIIDRGFDGMWFDFPNPFQRGDIIYTPGRLSKTDFECDYGPCVLEAEIPNRCCVERWKKSTGCDSSDMLVDGFFQREDGTVFAECTANYMNFEYYRGELTGKKRILMAISNYLKGEISLDLLLNAYHVIILEEHIKDARPYNITQEGIALAGITEDKNNE